jgi:hypothetical protein
LEDGTETKVKMLDGRINMMEYSVQCDVQVEIDGVIAKALQHYIER